MATLVETIATLSVNGRLGNNNNNNMVMTPSIKFSTFDGSKVEDWLFKYIQFFSVSELDEVAKVIYASMHLESKALAWHQAFVKNRVNIAPLGWTEYEVAVKTRFGDTQGDPMSELLVLK
ncbi:hypothetical protein vseg_017802 [Gypsophila vaccaria]